jgi:hypothetical protein
MLATSLDYIQSPSGQYWTILVSVGILSCSAHVWDSPSPKVPVPLHPGLSYPSDTKWRNWLYPWRWWAGSSPLSVTTYCTKQPLPRECQVYVQKPYVRIRRNFCYNVLVTFMQNIVAAILLNIPDSQREQWLRALHLKRISTLSSAGGGRWISRRVYHKLRFLQMSQSKWRSYPSNEIIIIHFTNPHLCIISASTISNFSRFASCNIQDTHRSHVCNG